MKIKILFMFFLILLVYGIYYLPVQKYYAEKTLDKYLVLQGVEQEKIQSKRIFKSYKSDGYGIDIVYKDDPEFKYSYYYYPRRRGNWNGMICIIVDKRGISADFSDISPKYPAIDYDKVQANLKNK